MRFYYDLIPHTQIENNDMKEWEIQKYEITAPYRHILSLPSQGPYEFFHVPIYTNKGTNSVVFKI